MTRSTPPINGSPLCADCRTFRRRSSEMLHQRSEALEQAFESSEVAHIEQDFDAGYVALFRAWMEHKETHETGSIRQYVRNFRDHSAKGTSTQR